jgi:hypothetical protein
LVYGAIDLLAEFLFQLAGVKLGQVHRMGILGCLGWRSATAGSQVWKGAGWILASWWLLWKANWLSDPF